MDGILSYKGYSLVFEDGFDGPALDQSRWNVELHPPGWVNEELQEYVDSRDTITLEDSKLLIRPVKTVHRDGSVSYTSGRISTQHKYDFTYGLFEARLKVPQGKGYPTKTGTVSGRSAGRSTSWRSWGIGPRQTTEPSTTACPTSRARGR